MTNSWTPDRDRVQRYRDRVQRYRDGHRWPPACAWHPRPERNCHFCSDSGPGPTPRPAWVETVGCIVLLVLAAAVLFGCAYVGISR